MKKTLLLASVAATIFAVNANATELNPYISAKMKYVDLTSEYNEQGFSLELDDKVLGGSVALGAALKTNAGTLRAEIEYNKNETAEKSFYNIISGEVDTQSLMLNAYYDIDTGTKLSPYIGAGIGYAKVEGKLTENISGHQYQSSMDDNTFAWQVGTGLGYAITENITIDAGYRYMDYGSFDEGFSELDTNAHEIHLGARYTF